MILFGTFGSTTLASGKLMAVLAATGVVLGAIYMLWMYQRVFLGKLKNEKNENLQDLSLREIIVLAPIVVFIFWLGVRPGLILDKVEASIEHTLAPLMSQVDPAHETNHHHALLLDETRNEVLVIRDTENR